MAQDYPDGMTRMLPGHTVDLEIGFARPWYDGSSVVIAAGASGSYTLDFEDDDCIYYIDVVNVSPSAYKEFTVIIHINDVPYVCGSVMGFFFFNLRLNPSLLFISGDSVKVEILNLDSAQLTFSVKLQGTKITRPVGFGKCPGAYYTASPLCGFAPLPVTFTDGSAHSPTSWEWKANVSEVDSIEQNPTISIVSTGLISPILKATNQYGYDTYSRSDYIGVADSSFISLFTESDAGGYLSGTSFPITITNLPQNVNAYIARDYGANAIDDYDMLLVAKLTGGSTYCIMPVAVIGNALPCLVSGGGYCISVFFNKASSSSYKIFIQIFNGVSAGASDSCNCSLNTYYYMRLVHASGSSTVTLYIYSDSTFSSLVDTLSVTDAICATLFRYYYLASSHNNSTALVSSGVVLNHGYVII